MLVTEPNAMTATPQVLVCSPTMAPSTLPEALNVHVSIVPAIVAQPQGELKDEDVTACVNTSAVGRSSR